MAEITISMEEMPEAIRGSWATHTILHDGTPLSLRGHSSDVDECIGPLVFRSGASTREDVLKVLGALAADVTSPSESKL